MAYDRKTALVHLAGQVSPLSVLIMQFYLWGTTLTHNHWRKELATSLKEIDDAMELTGNSRLKAKDVELTFQAIVKKLEKTYSEALDDPEYKSYKPERQVPPQPEVVTKLISYIGETARQGITSKWDFADKVIEIIQTW